MAEVRTVVPTGLGDTGLEVSWEIHTHCSCSRWRAHTTAQLWWGKETNIPWAATLQTSGAFHASSRLILTMILQGRTSLRTWYSEKECTHLESKSRDRAIQLEAWGSPLPPHHRLQPQEPGGFPTHHQAPCSTHTRDGGLFSMEIKHKRFKILGSQA